MDAAAALAELKGLSTQIHVVMLAGRDGSVTAATVADDRAAHLGQLARDLVAGADAVRGDLGRDGARPAQQRDGHLYSGRQRL